VKISLSPRERYTLFFSFCAGATWGGSEEALEARLHTWEQLRLSDFDNKKIDQAKLSNVESRFEISKATADCIVATCAAPGQNVSLGMMCARIVRKVRAVHPAPKTSNAAHP